MMAGAGGDLTPLGVDLRDAATGALVGVGRQRLTVALFAGRALAHVQQARPKVLRKNTPISATFLCTYT